jgi:hypothetical protein
LISLPAAIWLFNNIHDSSDEPEFLNLNDTSVMNLDSAASAEITISSEAALINMFRFLAKEAAISPLTSISDRENDLEWFGFDLSSKTKEDFMREIGKKRCQSALDRLAKDFPGNIRNDIKSINPQSDIFDRESAESLCQPFGTLYCSCEDCSKLSDPGMKIQINPYYYPFKVLLPLFEWDHNPHSIKDIRKRLSSMKENEKINLEMIKHLAFGYRPNPEFDMCENILLKFRPHHRRTNKDSVCPELIKKEN